MTGAMTVTVTPEAGVECEYVAGSPSALEEQVALDEVGIGRVASDSSVAKALHLLESFGGGIQQLGVSELARRTGIPKSSVHRLCVELTECGFLTRTPRRQYRLALRVFELGTAGPVLAELRQTMSRFLQQLTVLSGETVHLGVLDGTDVVYLDKIETPQSERLPSRVGHRNPVYCTGIGKALLAWNPGQYDELVAREELPVFTARTISTGPRLRRELDIVRTKLVAFDREERTPGIACVATPIKDRSGRAAAAISVAGPTSRMTEERLISLAGVVERVGHAAGNYLRRRGVI